MKLATIGSGVIVYQFLEAAISVEGVELVGAYSRTLKTATELKDKFSMLEAYDDYDKFIHSGSFDTIYIASPNSLHYQQAKDCLKANKNIIVEKPFCSNNKESLEIINLANEMGLYVFEAMSINYMPNLELLKTKLDEIKPIHWIELSMCQYSSKFDEFKRGGLPNVFNPAFSGGSLMDLNIYHYHFIQNLFGRPLKSSYYPMLAKNGIDVSGQLLMEYPDFMVSAIAAKNAKGKPYGVIHGENGIIEFNEGINGLRSFTLNGERHNIQKEDNRLVYEIKAFESILKNRDIDVMKKQLLITQERMNMLTEVRINSGIYFTADE